MIPAKQHWKDLATIPGERGREDCQAGWHALAAVICKGADVIDVGAGMGYSRARLLPSVRSLRLQDPGPGLPADITCDVSEIPDNDCDFVTAFDVIEHVQDDRKFVEHLTRISRRGVFVTTPNWFISRAANEHHCREYLPCQLVELLEGFAIAGLWAGNSLGTEVLEVGRESFIRHRSPHQAALFLAG